MPLVIFGLLLLGLVFLPSWWVRRTLKRYNRARTDFPGTGGELARHLLDRLNMPNVRVEMLHSGEYNDHYDPLTKTVRLSAVCYQGVSLTAIVVATHEVGHALQDHLGYRPLKLRTRLVRVAVNLEKLGAILMVSVPLVTLVLKIPAASLLLFFGGLLSLGTAVIVHLLTLPVEIDASFERALPILIEGDYLPAQDIPAARRILRACALTYVATALASLLNLWRWLAVLRR
jgi:uncharacterized protein